MRSALAVLSVIVLVIHGVVFYNQFFARWQEYQTDYFAKAIAEPGTSDLVKETLRNRRPAIEQTIVRSFGSERVDRCQTCHIAIDDPRFEGANQPLKTHPKIPSHKFETYGCTVCHDGQGRAVFTKAAHEGGEDWPWPMVSKDMIQANCVQCHVEPGWEHAPLVNEGRQLFFQRACYTCHTIAGLSFGSIGPELTEVGRRRRPDYILGKILDPRATNPTSTMPKQDLTDHQRAALATFLKAQQGSRISRAPLQQFVSAQAARPEWLEVAVIAGPEAAQAMGKETAAKRGEMLLPRAGCLSCHKLGEVDGKVGPDIEYASAQRDFGWLMAHFKDPRSVVPGSIMPPYPLPSEAFVSLTEYLTTRPMPKLIDNPAEEYKAICARCHGEKGAGDGVISRYLDPRPRDLTKAAFLKSKPHERLVNSVMNGVPGTSMAPWGKVLGQERATRLVDYVLENISKGGTARVATNRKVPTTNPVPFSAESTSRGEAIFLDRCWGCHGKKADGHGPNAVDIWPRPRNLRNKPFVIAASYARLHESIKYGVQGSAMPAAGFDFNLDDKSIGDVINYIHGLNGMGASSAQAAQSAPAPAATATAARTAKEGGEKSHER